jgi:hypothetical protein
MVHPSLIEARLGELGFKASRWFNAEIRELEHILMDHEKIISLACGRYFGSFALLVATDQRLLLIDKRVFFMTIEDTRYDMISEIDYNSQVYNATVTVFTMNKTHKFTSWKYKRELRELTTYVQRRVMEFRQQQPSSIPQLMPAEKRYIPSAVQPPAEPFQPVHTAAAQLPATQPADYYVDDSHSDGHHIKEHVGHVAHLVGSAAMHAAHPTSVTRRPFHPFVQGSLMTRRPIGSPTPTSLDY